MIWKNGSCGIDVVTMSPIVTAGSGAPAIMAIDKNDPVVLAIHRTVTTAPEFAHMGTDEAITRLLLRNLVAFYLLLPVGLSSNLCSLLYSRREAATNAETDSRNTDHGF